MTQADHDPGDDLVTFNACDKMQGKCKSNNKMIVGALVTFFIALLFILYTQQQATAEKVSGLKAGEAAAGAKLDDVQKDVKEIRFILEKRR